MPVYEYGCEAGHRFEVKQKFSDEPLTTCRECDRPVTKVISVPAISFKGSGWYVTSEEKSTSSKEPAKPESTTASSGSDGKGSAPAAAPAAPAAASKSETGAAPPASASSGS